MSCGIYDALVAIGYAFIVGLFGLIFILLKISWDIGEKKYEVHDLLQERNKSNVDETTSGSNIRRK